MTDGERTSRAAPYRISVIVILLCGFVAAATIYIDGRRGENERAEAEFERHANVRHALTREVLQRYGETIFGLSAMFTLDAEVTRADFVRAASQLRPRLSGVLAIEWAPYVARADRARVEASMQRVYAPQRFEFVEFDAEGRIRRAGDRPFYLPLCYVEPLPGNEIVLGYDLLTAPTLPYLERSRVTRRMEVSHQFRLRQETTDQLGITMTLPVFHDAPTPTPEAPPPVGYLQFVFHVRELLEQASGTQTDGVLEMLFVDNSESDPARRILHFQPAPGAAAPAQPPGEAQFRADASFVRELALPFGERDWRVVYRPRRGWLATQHSFAPWWRAATLLSLSGLLAGLISVIGRRTQTIHREVDDRTAELAESRRQFTNFVHALPGMAYRGRYTDQLEVVFASEGTLGLTGYPAEEFVAGSIHVRDLIHPDDVDRVRQETRSALAARRDIELTYRMRSRDGTEKSVLSRGRGVYGADGTLQVIEGIVIDITDQKRAEEARLALERKLLETQKLESLGLLAGGIAHDFNNLLSAVLGNASLARMTLDAGSAVDPHLRAIETAALRAAELCRQMLAYAGKGRFVVERVDLSAVVEDLLPLLRVSIARSAVLHLELAKDLPGVKADATQIRQIVMNLVLNAVDAVAGRNGEITLRTSVTLVDRALLARCVTGQNLPLGHYVLLEVNDTGCGMSNEVLSKIFDPFYTTKFAGRGLGLAAVLGIVRGHNGALLVESQPEQGSRFQLFLPAIVGEAIAKEASPAPPEPPWRQTGDVLVIEDEEPVRTVMTALLESFGFTPHAVADGRAGLEAFRENASRWTLVVVDLVMPGMSGEETLAALQAMRSDVRVLLVSGYSEGEIMNRVKSGGGRIGFLPKPFKREAFEAKLKELFG